MEKAESKRQRREKMDEEPKEEEEEEEEKKKRRRRTGKIYDSWTSSSSGNQVDGLPLVTRTVEVLSYWKSNTGAVRASFQNRGSASIGDFSKKVV